LLLILIINPRIRRTTLENIKPALAVVVDNSRSMAFFEEQENLKYFIQKFNRSSLLAAKFKINIFNFSKDLNISDSLSFSGTETNIYQAITAVNKLHSSKNEPIILLTDGNQTIGNSYEFVKSEHPIYPIVFGDTTKYTDLKISQVNANKYSYIGNKFPVEVILNYEGNDTITSIFSIANAGNIIYSKKIQFSRKEKSQIVTTNLSASEEGVNYFMATIKRIKGEKNTLNNAKDFSVSVMDEKAKVLILSASLHPDIGALKKAIESNKQRVVIISKMADFRSKLNDFQLIVLYEPNESFRSVLTQAKKANINLLLITGANTDWDFINQQDLGFTKNTLLTSENYEATFNSSFGVFIQRDIGFGQFSPLEDTFGALEFYQEHADLLFQKVRGIKSEQPLITFLEKKNQKLAVIFGTGIWKWRASSYLKGNTFRDFDQFLGNIVQYTVSNKKRARLEVNSENIYSANSSVNMSAFFTDSNYRFDKRASLEITLTNTATKKRVKLPFSVVNEAYQISIENLISGDYRFKVAVLGEDYAEYGQFKIVDYQVEEQFTNANVRKLKQLALRTEGVLFYKNEIDSLVHVLLKDERYYTTQKSSIHEHDLISWKWILVLIIAFFATEWFFRKYYGEI
jgi:hypothetical protein